MTDARGEHEVRVGLEDWVEGRTGISGARLHHEYELASMRVVAGGRWLDPESFEMVWQFHESAFRDRVVCRFKDRRMTLDRSVNVNSGAKSLPTLTAWAEA